jgi:predicted Mrr-cat superfamily restriction endonuclease
MSFVIPWIQLTSIGDGFKVVESVFFRVYLENYKQAEGLTIRNESITGNVWSFIHPLKNGNLASLFVYGTSTLLILFMMRDFSKKRFLQNVLWMLLSFSAFGLAPIAPG